MADNAPGRVKHFDTAAKLLVRWANLSSDEGTREADALVNEMTSNGGFFDWEAFSERVNKKLDEVAIRQILSNAGWPPQEIEALLGERK